MGPFYPIFGGLIACWSTTLLARSQVYEPSPKALRKGVYNFRDPVTDATTSLMYKGLDPRAVIAIRWPDWWTASSLLRLIFPKRTPPPCWGTGEMSLPWVPPRFDPANEIGSNSATTALGGSSSGTSSGGSSSGISTSNGGSSSDTTTSSGGSSSGTTTTTVTDSTDSTYVPSTVTTSTTSSTDSEDEECVRVRHGQYYFILFIEEDSTAQCQRVCQDLGYGGYLPLYRDDLPGRTNGNHLAATWEMCSGDPFVGMGRRVRVIEEKWSVQIGDPFEGSVGLVIEDNLRSGQFTVRLDAGQLELRFFRSQLVDLAMEEWYDKSQGHGEGAYLGRLRDLIEAKGPKKLSNRGKGKRDKNNTDLDRSMSRGGVNMHVKALCLQRANFTCNFCGTVFCAETSRSLDLAHKKKGSKGQYLRDTDTDPSQISGLQRLGFRLPTKDYVTEVFDLCVVACHCCHQLYDNFPEAGQTEAGQAQAGQAEAGKAVVGQAEVGEEEEDSPMLPSVRFSARQLDYLEWRDSPCTYGSDPDRDHGREWKDGDKATGCLFRGDTEGWPDVQEAFLTRCEKKGYQREVAISCVMEGDHVGVVPDKNPLLKRKAVTALTKADYEKELKKMRPLCYACHRWVTHGPPDFSDDGDYGTIYNQLTACFGDPLRDPTAVEDFEAVGRDWRKYMEKRAAGRA